MSDSAAQRRARQTVTNLVIALGACLALVAVIYLIAPHSDKSMIKKVDYQSIAEQANSSYHKNPIAPTLPEGWWSNRAVFDPNPGYGLDATWTVGFVGPKNEFIGLTESYATDKVWLQYALTGHEMTGTLNKKGNLWEVWDSRSKHDPVQMKDHQFVLRLPDRTIQLYGTATPAQFDQFLTAIDRELKGTL